MAADPRSRHVTALNKVRDQLARAERQVTELRAERVARYKVAHDGSPPWLTYDEIAEASGVTAAAVQQAIFKADNPKPHGRPGRPRGAKAKAK